jgi:hypothetical protein
MRTIKLGSALAVAFLVGCMASTIAPFKLAPARANEGPRWEYLCTQEPSYQHLIDHLNERGAEGWELVVTADHPVALLQQGTNWCFKRQVR